MFASKAVNRLIILALSSQILLSSLIVDYSMPDRSSQRYSTGAGLPYAPDTSQMPSGYGSRPEADFPPTPSAAMSTHPHQNNRYSQQYDAPSHTNSSNNYPGSPASAQPSTPTSYSNYLAESDQPTGNTPGVIGAQEVYRDPRSRIEAQQRSHKAGTGQAGDRMSFRDKMKMFASEAGESTPVQRPKASKSQRALEESLSYGNGHM